MAIRLRIVDKKWIAVCAACTVEKPDDVYIDDGQHGALADKFSRDFNDMFGGDLPHDASCAVLVELEESDNPARTWWDQVYGDNGATPPPGHAGIAQALKDAATGQTKPDVEVRGPLSTAIN